MARVRGERRANGPLWWVFLALAVYALASAAIAVSTSGDCGSELDARKEWQWFPPQWECIR